MDANCPSSPLCELKISQLKHDLDETKKRVDELQGEVNSQGKSLAVLNAKVALAGAVGAMVGSGVMAGLLKLVAHGG